MESNTALVVQVLEYENEQLLELSSHMQEGNVHILSTYLYLPLNVMIESTVPRT